MDAPLDYSNIDSISGRRSEDFLEIPAVMLNLSYRLPALLCNFVSGHMYDKLLLSARQGDALHHLFTCGAPDVLEWHDVQGQQELKGFSTFNPIEARVAVRLATGLQKSGQNNWKVRAVLDTFSEIKLVQERLDPCSQLYHCLYLILTIKVTSLDSHGLRCAPPRARRPACKKPWS